MPPVCPKSTMSCKYCAYCAECPGCEGPNPKPTNSQPMSPTYSDFVASPLVTRDHHHYPPIKPERDVVDWDAYWANKYPGSGRKSPKPKPPTEEAATFYVLDVLDGYVENNKDGSDNKYATRALAEEAATQQAKKNPGRTYTVVKAVSEVAVPVTAPVVKVL